MDIEIQAREIMYHKGNLNRILAFHTGQPVEKVDVDTDRDRYMSPIEAKEYGLIDAVVGGDAATLRVVGDPKGARGGGGSGAPGGGRGGWSLRRPWAAGRLSGMCACRFLEDSGRVHFVGERLGWRAACVAVPGGDARGEVKGGLGDICHEAQLALVKRLR